AIKLAGLPEAEATLLAARNGRDKNRTPTQWANLPNAGFSPAGVTTWLPVNPDYTSGVNVTDQEKDPGSLLNFYKNVLRMRRENSAVISGDYQALEEESKKCLVFLRTSSEQRCLVAINMSAEEQHLSLDLPLKKWRLVFSTHARPAGEEDLTKLVLSPYEALIVDV
ncbi:MAG: alpha-glucosidase C-terminal domain-containing protein, partial [Anaerolineaceae bacterium]|nr:alpha-glucosidase C-terminal domain-containing protein [Anaerolineaceae bacterium]